MQTLLACDDHRVTQSQALKDLNFTGLTQTNFDRHTFRDLFVLIGTRHNFDDKCTAALRHDGFLGYHQGIFSLPKDCADTGEHARAQLHLAVVDTPTHTDGTSVGIDERVNGLNDGCELSAGQCIKRDLRFLTRFDFGLKAFGQTEIQQDCVNVFNVDHVSTIF